MKKILIILIALLLASGCATNSVDNPLETEKIKNNFEQTILAQQSINGNLPMYDQLKKQFDKANNNLRRKAINYMTLNPRLNYYLTNKYTKDKMNKILNDKSMIFIPEDESLGFNVPYIIDLPNIKYKNANANSKQYMLFEGSNYIDTNTPYGIFDMIYAREKFKNIKSITVAEDIADQLYMPRVMTIQSQPSIRDYAKNDYNMARLMNRLSVLAKIEDYKDNRINPMDGFGKTTVENYELVFNEYLFKQHIDYELQVMKVIMHSQSIIRDLGFPVEDKIFMGGFSGNGAFTARFATIYPEILKAIYHGGNLYPTIPNNQYLGKKLVFPLGVADNKELFNKEFNLKEYNKVAKLEIFGQNEVWTNYPNDALDGVEKTSIQLFGEVSYSHLLYNHEAYFEAGGEKITIINKSMGHELDSNDFEYIKDFLMFNRDSDQPFYPVESKYTNHIYISHLNQDNLLKEINNNQIKIERPYILSRLVIFTSLENQGLASEHALAAQARFQTGLIIAPSVFDPELLNNNVFLLIYDSQMRSRIKLSDLKLNVVVNPGEVISTTNENGKRFIIIYPTIDSDAKKLIQRLPSNITVIDQRY